jgi:hypothetical protein
MSEPTHDLEKISQTVKDLRIMVTLTLCTLIMAFVIGVLALAPGSPSLVKIGVILLALLAIAGLIASDLGSEMVPTQNANSSLSGLGISRKDPTVQIQHDTETLDRYAAMWSSLQKLIDALILILYKVRDPRAVMCYVCDLIASGFVVAIFYVAPDIPTLAKVIIVLLVLAIIVGFTLVVLTQESRGRSGRVRRRSIYRSRQLDLLEKK